eukprot:6009640-Prymnesium_polylepis.1
MRAWKSRAQVAHFLHFSQAMRSAACRPPAEWHKLAEDQATETPIFVFDRFFTAEIGCETPEFFLWTAPSLLLKL